MSQKIVPPRAPIVKKIWFWTKSEEWNAILEILGYEGDRSFIRLPKRDTDQDAGKFFEQAIVVYQNILLPHSQVNPGNSYRVLYS